MSFVFGPVSSRRFGLSLGIDLSPDRKRCNYDCLYCELKKADPIAFFDSPIEPDAIIQEVEAALKTCTPNVLTITANGEPTLYPYLNELVDRLNAIKRNAKLMILSNASAIGVPNVSDALSKIDIVKLSLDAAEPIAFKKIDRPQKNYSDLNAIINGMIAFRKRYKGTLAIEILLVDKVNDTPANFEALALALKKIAPDRIDIGTIERPSAYKVQAAAPERIRALADCLKGLNAQIIPNKHAVAKQSLNKSAILELLKRRSLGLSEAESILDQSSLELLNSLVTEGAIVVKTQGGKTFYALK
ncbi:MAG: radical SAM protein [Helicobacteraceae bacterium]|jgi:wyosine [tRNA(Phe)-imidazoG37] synthetase (radical SAM superfamily)|nr:radical SAM protein [Helicobacteraceae bacterium]